MSHRVEIEETGSILRAEELARIVRNSPEPVGWLLVDAEGRPSSGGIPVKFWPKPVKMYRTLGHLRAAVTQSKGRVVYNYNEKVTDGKHVTYTPAAVAGWRAVPLYPDYRRAKELSNAGD